MTKRARREQARSRSSAKALRRRTTEAAFEDDRAQARHQRKHHGRVTTFTRDGRVHPLTDLTGYCLRHLGLLDIIRREAHPHLDRELPPIIRTRRS